MSENKILSDLIKFRNENIKDNQDPSLLYISTANMNPEKNGINLKGNNSLGKDGKKFYKDDILISNIRPYFKKIWKADRDGISSADVLNFIPIDENLIDSTYLYYLLSADNFFGYMTATSRGTKMPRGDKSAIKKYEVPNHPLLTQQGIANILSSFDDKIENNNAIIANLEKQAQAIFRSWFVDFEPFQNEKFKDGINGLIPESFTITKIKNADVEITDYVANGSFKSLKDNVNLLDENSFALYIRNTDLKQSFKNDLKFVDKPSYEFLKKTKLKGYEVIISNVADVGRVYLLPDIDKPMTLGSNVILLKDSKNYDNNIYYYRLFKSPLGQHLIESITGGSAQLKFNKTDFRNLNILIPDKITMKKYLDLSVPIEQKIVNIFHQNRKLSEIRDTLLPKLMSGEIRVEEAIEVE